MQKVFNRACACVVGLLTLAALVSLVLVIYFIFREALPLFSEVSLSEFLLGQRWMPIDYTGSTSFGIFNFIISTLFVSLLALAISLLISLGAALFLSCVASERARGFLYPLIDLLAGIPSVVYGFVGIVVMLPLFMKAGVSTGSCILAAAILLAIMLFPFLIGSCSESLLKARTRYGAAASALGVDSWYAAGTLLLPATWRGIVMAVVLAIGRAMGETMAVMMVIGNANMFPTLLGKGESIASLIALEMGTAVVDSTHYHALYAAGLVLMVLLLAINIVITLIKRRIEKKGWVS